MATYNGLQKQIDYARKLYSWRNYDRAWEVLMEVISQAPVGPSQKALDRAHRMFESGGVPEAFRLLGDMAKEAAEEVRFASIEGYGRALDGEWRSNQEFDRGCRSCGREFGCVCR